MIKLGIPNIYLISNKFIFWLKPFFHNTVLLEEPKIKQTIGCKAEQPVAVDDNRPSRPPMTVESTKQGAHSLNHRLTPSSNRDSSCKSPDFFRLSPDMQDENRAMMR